MISPVVKPVGVPARFVEHALVADAKMDRLIHAVTVDELVRNRRSTSADALVGFLQCNDVGVDLLKHLEDTMRVAAPIKADRLVHVVRCKGDAGAAGHVTANSRCS